MITNRVYKENLIALKDKVRLIINKGGTRSGKTFSILQIIALLGCYGKKQKIISVVSHSLPHLKLGAMRDFDNILTDMGIIVDEIKNLSESTYYFGGGVIVEFFGVDNLGKVHGPQRDILFVNECNHIKNYDIIRQLLVRTSETAYFDYNPSREFWIDTEIIGKRECKVITSTYLDNMFLSAHQIEEIESNKHNENWWRVYGLGLTGQLEGTIFSNWVYGEFDNSLPFGYGLDFGSRDPDAMVKCAIDFDKQTIYLDEILYQNGLNTNDLGKLINSRIDKDKLIIADSAATRTIQDLKHIGLNITGVSKDPVIDSIKQLSNFKLIITETSYNIVRELQNYVWLDKKGEIPIDTFNHLIDAFRYIAMTFIKAKTKHSTGHKLAHYSPIYHR